MRIFMAIEPSETLKDEIAGLARQLAMFVKGRFIPRSNYHVTLAFLGDASGDEVHRAIEAMDVAVYALQRTCLGDPGWGSSAGRCSQDDDGVPLRPDGLGKFGRASNATLWLGFAKEPSLMRLASELRSSLDDKGITYDDKAFLPHVTLARHASIPRYDLPDLAFPAESPAARISLFKSTLSKEGATYEPLHSIEL